MTFPVLSRQQRPAQTGTHSAKMKGIPFMRFNRLIPRKPQDEPEGPVSLDTAKMPDGHRAYVIGDIHGRNDLLQDLLQKIADDYKSRSTAKGHLVFLGDYIDRGRHSREVINTLLSLNLADMKIVSLRGNHETAMQAFLDDPVRGKRWLYYGGDATLSSYGIDVALCNLTEEDILEAGHRLKMAMPSAHSNFLNGLVDSHILGDYFFVHAGVDPCESLDKQDPHDLHWIRDEFLDHEGLYEKIIVHGHSISATPEFRNNRIAIDTGAFYSNLLTCLVLEGSEKVIL
ncbi:MAG: serine/threonine protein phosphatase [Alphaproteobacteria bacterium]|nr:MAG: serine/threonine protein phosphatase [Alphaproteobacteria bacterium]